MSGSAPGIQQSIYIDGFNISVPADRLRWKAARAETVERLLNSFAVVDRPFAFDGAPNVITKFSFELGYPSIAEADYQAFTEVEALSGFFDLCIWKPLTETFSGDGTTTVFNLLRRVAIEEIDGGDLPVDAAALYATAISVDGTPLGGGDFAVGSPDATTGVTPVTFDSAPAAGDDNVRIFYVPLFYVRVVDPEREFSVPFIETTTLKLEEA